jgi:predicted extracellular nuclease
LIVNPFRNKKRFCFAFYNIENLFDIYNDELKHDKDFTENSELRWTLKRYKNKIKKISYAISQIGLAETKERPAIIGLAEVENKQVLNDLIQAEALAQQDYKYLHFDSKDERGIDVALLYDPKKFELLHAEVKTIVFDEENGDKDYTRDVLHVFGKFLGEKIDILVNHWPSKRSDNENGSKRLLVSNLVSDIVGDIRLKNEFAKIMIMGDFNDDPSSESVKNLVNNNQLYNPMDTLLSIDRGTTVHRGEWNLFDQMILSVNCFERKKNSLRFDSANIFDADFLKQQDGDYKGTPYRTYVGKSYKGGYSDHFPVYTIMKK